MSMFCLSPMNSECIINQFQGPVIFEGWRQPSPYNTAMRTIGLRRLGGLAPGFEGNMTRLLVLLVFDLPLGLRRRRWPRFFWPFFPVAAFEEHNSSNHLKLHVPYICHIFYCMARATYFNMTLTLTSPPSNSLMAPPFCILTLPSYASA